jgi:hypothetical protein
MTRTRNLLLALGVASLLGLTACGTRGPAQAADPASAPEGVEAAALTAMGFDVGLTPVTDPAPAPSGSAAPKAGHKNDRRPLGRAMLRRNTLHGEAVVQTKDGVKTVVVQRGTVTAIDDKTVSVKSTDGYAQTWTFGNPIRVVERRGTVQPSAIKAGAEIGVAGTKDGGTTSARLIVIRS